MEQLNARLATFTQRQDALVQHIAHMDQTIRAQAQAGNKQAAMTLLKRKKDMEGQLQRITNNITMLEKQKNSLDNASMASDTMDALSTTNVTIRDMSRNLDPEKADRVFEDMSTVNDRQAEIDHIFNSEARRGVNSDVLEDELEEYMVDATPLPLTVPTTPQPAAQAVSQAVSATPPVSASRYTFGTTTPAKNEKLAELEDLLS